MDTPLNERQLAIARLVADGLLNKEIVDRLGISMPTIKHQITAIMEQTGAHNRAAIAAWYVRAVEVR